MIVAVVRIIIVGLGLGRCTGFASPVDCDLPGTQTRRPAKLSMSGRISREVFSNGFRELLNQHSIGADIAVSALILTVTGS